MWVVDLALKRVARCLSSADSRVVLRHSPTGRVLTDGSSDGSAVMFADKGSAWSFRRRFMDEHEAWETVGIDDAARAA
jgi:hypothetical protein